MRVLRTLSTTEIEALSPVLGTPVGGGFFRLPNRQSLNPSTGQLLSRRQTDETFGAAQGTTFERKAKTRKEQGIGKTIIRRKSEKFFPTPKRTHTEFTFTLNVNDDDYLARDFIPRLAILRTRYGRRGNPTVYVKLILEMPDEYDGEKIQERQTRSVNAFNDGDLDLIRDDLEHLLKSPSKPYKKIRQSLMVWVRDARK